MPKKNKYQPIRSLEELSYMVRNTFTLLNEWDDKTRAESKGKNWVLYYPENGRDNEIFIRPSNLTTFLGEVQKDFAREHEDKVIPASSLKKHLASLGIIIENNTPRRIRIGNQSELKRVCVVDMNIVNFYMDVPLLHKDIEREGRAAMLSERAAEEKAASAKKAQQKA